MTKPQTSKEKSKSPKPIKNRILIIEEDNENITIKQDLESNKEPKTAKDLFSIFTVKDSDNDDDDNADNSLNDQDYEPSSKKAKENISKKYVPKYRKEWENKPELKSWLSESIHGNTYFYCKFCKNDYRCGISEIHKHMASKKHIQRATTPDSKGQKFTFRGLLCPVFTPFQSSRITPGINFKAIPKYSQFLTACGVKGVLINDIIGEGMSLTTKERMAITESWSEACKKNGQFLMVQIGGAPLKDVIEMALHAKRLEIGALVILPDLYNKPKNHLDLTRYLKLISEAVKDIPILYHHNPKFMQMEINMASFLLDIIGEIDSFVGLIYSTNDLQQIVSVVSINEKFTVFMGTDEAILGAAASGYTCIMGSTLNILPKLVESICECVKNGKIQEAQTSQNLLNKAIDVIYKHGDLVPALKAAMETMTNICGTNTREPLQTLWGGVVKKMEVKLRELGII